MQYFHGLVRENPCSVVAHLWSCMIYNYARALIGTTPLITFHMFITEENAGQKSIPYIRQDFGYCTSRSVVNDLCKISRTCEVCTFGYHFIRKLSGKILSKF